MWKTPLCPYRAEGSFFSPVESAAALDCSKIMHVHQVLYMVYYVLEEDRNHHAL